MFYLNHSPGKSKLLDQDLQKELGILGTQLQNLVLQAVFSFPHPHVHSLFISPPSPPESPVLSECHLSLYFWLQSNQPIFKSKAPSAR